MRTMYDAVTPSNVPVNAQMVAGYIDGNYRSYQALVARCPNAIHVPIAVHASTNDGIVLDVEQGDATPSQAPGWVRMRRAAGVDPTVYCSLAWWPAVKQAFAAQGVAEPHYWIAAYPGNGANLYPGAVAHQYQDYQNLYDISVVADFWPGVDGAAPVPGPAPIPVPTPSAHKETDMFMYSYTDSAPHFYIINSRATSEIDAAHYLELAVAGVPHIDKGSVLGMLYYSNKVNGWTPPKA